MRWRKMNQSDVARAIGISRQQVSMYFRGVTNLSYDSTEKLLDYFDLVKDEDIKEKPKFL